MDRYLVRPAREADAAALVSIDPLAAAGDQHRQAAIHRWCGQGLVLVAASADRPVGYCVVEYTFFEQAFVTMLVVATDARRHGIGRRLLDAAVAGATTPKVFTSTNVSNQPMQRLLRRAGWAPVGLVHGLDDGDPELFYAIMR